MSDYKYLKYGKKPFLYRNLNGYRRHFVAFGLNTEVHRTENPYIAVNIFDSDVFED